MAMSNVSDVKDEKKRLILQVLREMPKDCPDHYRDGMGITRALVGKGVRAHSYFTTTDDLAKHLQELIDEGKVKVRVKAEAGEKYWRIVATFWPAEEK